MYHCLSVANTISIHARTCSVFVIIVLLNQCTEIEASESNYHTETECCNPCVCIALFSYFCLGLKYIQLYHSACHLEYKTHDML